ncbi:hypothetical protein VNI00_007712 [Paramarasmius palmivorus]|uniref:RRM domain-containing protein n=1 Tax=Paramarasmius palmivorus TaxID=297713 RepID=A0AAW0D3C7_9AGAR
MSSPVLPRVDAKVKTRKQRLKDERKLYTTGRAFYRYYLDFEPCKLLCSNNQNLRDELNAQRPPRTSYAFVEFRSTRDAEDAYNDMEGRYFEGYRLSVEWAKNPPSSVWRFDRRGGDPPSRSSRPAPSERDRQRSRSPRRSDRDRHTDDKRERDRYADERDRRERDYHERDRHADDRDRRDRFPEDRGRERRRSRTPPPANGDRYADRDRDRRRSLSPRDRERDRDRARTPPPPLATSMAESRDDRAVERGTPPGYTH